MTTHADLVEVFGEHRVFRVPLSRLENTPLPETARSDLSETGLPEVLRDAVYISDAIAEEFPLYAEWCEKYNLRHSAEAGGFFRLGHWRGGSICMDPETGKISYVSPYEETEIHPMNSSPGQLGTCMMIAQRDSEPCDFMPLRLVLAERERIIQRLIEVDEQAVRPDNSVWRVLAEEVTGAQYRP
ncbi:SUKH-4 family immunity protein [Streptomyces sp. NPDC088090]|uniref:SUKH-4 family immunity protein n=1 Tax=Streptomyces sp. NPDC088090 TaxID=3365822 RepID=UPI00384F8D68